MSSSVESSSELIISTDEFIPPLPLSPPTNLIKPQPPDTKEDLDINTEESTTLKRKRSEGVLSDENQLLPVDNDPFFEEEEELSFRDSLIDNLEHNESQSDSECSIPSSSQGRADSSNNKDDATEECGFEPYKKLLEGKLPKLALPEGWIALNHSSGGIIYLQRESRVVTWSRPYLLGTGSVRKHHIPLAAIPCLHQIRGDVDNTKQNQGEELNKIQEDELGEKKKGSSESVLNFLNTAGTSANCAKEDGRPSNDCTVLQNGDCSTSKTTKQLIKEEPCDGGITEESTSERNDKSNKDSENNNPTDSNAEKNTSDEHELDLISGEEFSTYLSKLWEFQSLSWEQEKNATVAFMQNGPELPSSLESVPYSFKGLDSQKKCTKEYIFNPTGKSPVAILHEYCQRVLKVKPEYVTGECEDANTPFTACVKIEGIIYGEGKAVNKKQAKQISARTTLDILMPGLFSKSVSYEISEHELKFFDTIDIEDKNLFELCLKTGIPTGSHILQECLRRNQGVCPTEIYFKIIPGTKQNNSYQMTVGKHSMQGPCKNKKIGKQLGSQGILKKLHPHISKWGSLLRIYCDRPSAVIKKFKSDDNELKDVNPSSSESGTQVNTDLLGKLKAEMNRLAKKQARIKKRDQQSNHQVKPCEAKHGEPLHNMDI